MPTARDLARAHDGFLDHLYRGDAASARRFLDWLAPFWVPFGPPEPARPPDAVSRRGEDGSAAGVRWYAEEGVILGYESAPWGRARGCWRVPAGAAAPPLPAIPSVPWMGRDGPPAEPFDGP